jgi:hypothetical protein
VRVARLMLAAAVAGAVGCSGSDDPTEPNVPLDVELAGTWQFIAALNHSSPLTTCFLDGTVNVGQSDHALAGTVAGATACNPDAGTPRPTMAGAMTNGAFQDDSTLAFVVGDCAYAGRMQATPGAGDQITTLSGYVTCTATANGVSYPYSGTWAALR